MLFTINNKDYTNNIVAGSYKVNSSPTYEHYEDAKGRTHNIKIRDRVSGSFDLFFRTLDEFNAFVSDFENGRNAMNNYHSVYLKVNNKNVANVYDCFLTFTTSRGLKASMEDYMEKFTLTLEER